jgi:hypothetical protein
MCDEHYKPLVGRRLICTEMNVFNPTRTACFQKPSLRQWERMDDIVHWTVMPRRLRRSPIPHSDAKGANMLDAEYRSWRILLLCTIRQFRGAQRNIDYEEVLTADDNARIFRQSP